MAISYPGKNHKEQFSTDFFTMLGWLLIPVFEKIDSFLARHGSFEDLQNFRLSVVHYYLQHKKIDRTLPGKLCDQLMNREVRLRQLAQWEEVLSERYQALKMQPSGEENERRLTELSHTLESTRKEYWFIEREIYAKEASLPVRPLRKAYRSWRSNPAWYLHPYLVDRCVGFGGCCSRDCGCCERRLDIADRRRAVGHCTANCGCCAKSRGFDLEDPVDAKRIVELYNQPVQPGPNDDFYNQLSRAYFFGIGSRG